MGQIKLSSGLLQRYKSKRRSSASSLNRWKTLSRPKRFFLCSALVPFLAAGGASGAYYLRMHRLCEGMDISSLPSVPSPVASRRILVLSPHCDDETLGAGGLISEARRNGAAVQVAFLTNGDGFRVAASRSLKEVNVGPADFIRFAELRQQEALRALAQLGVTEDNVRFLGYPDRGLQAMWEANWNVSHPFRSGFTGHTHCPYPRAFTPHTPYCGTALVRDISRLIRDFQPTDILVTHPADDHTDHSIAAAYAQAALRACQQEGVPGTAQARLRYYIVHRGDWPLPQGSHPERPLSPPPGLIALDTRWSAFDLSPADEEAKRKALEEYVSQLNITARFLRTFVRTNELIGSLPEETATPMTSESAPDATGDNVARYADPAADLTRISVARSGKDLAVSVQVRGRPSNRVRYQLLLRADADQADMPTQASRSHFVTLNLPTHGSGTDGRTIEARIPLSSIGILGNRTTPTAIWVCAETRWSAANIQAPVDRTGYRLFLLSGEQQGIAKN